MILIEGQKLYCRLCNKEVNKEDALFFYGIEPNENKPLAIFNDAIVHKECFEEHPLKQKVLDRMKEFEKYQSQNNVDYITGEDLSLENIGHPDNLINVFYLTDDKNNQLYKYNGISLNKRNLSKWKEYDKFLKLLIELNASGKWEGNALKYLISHLRSPIRAPFTKEFLNKMKERYPDKFK